jgi:hypothetical protein
MDFRLHFRYSNALHHYASIAFRTRHPKTIHTTRHDMTRHCNTRHCTGLVLFRTVCRREDGPPVQTDDVRKPEPHVDCQFGHCSILTTYGVHPQQLVLICSLLLFHKGFRVEASKKKYLQAVSSTCRSLQYSTMHQFWHGGISVPATSRRSR